MARDDPQDLKNASAHTFYIRNAERKLKLVAKSERQMDQFIASIEKMSQKTIWASRNRFSSFAPIRMNCSAQWLVDGVSQSSKIVLSWPAWLTFFHTARLLLELVASYTAS